MEKISIKGKEKNKLKQIFLMDDKQKKNKKSKNEQEKYIQQAPYVLEKYFKNSKEKDKIILL